MIKKTLPLCLLAMSTLQVKAQYLEKIYDYIENTNVYEENQEEGHAYYLADKHLSLNGSWKFLFANTPEEVPNDFFRLTFSDSKWGKITPYGDKCLKKCKFLKSTALSPCFFN